MSENDDYPWAWYAGDGERFAYGPHATREDAIDDAMNNECGYDDEDEVCRFEVMEAYQKPLDLATLMPSQMERIIERWDEHLSEDYGDPESGDSMLQDIVQSDWDDLKARLCQAVSDWQRDRGIALKSWRFTQTRNTEELSIAVAEYFPATAEQAK